MTERALRQAVVGCAALYGYTFVYHAWLSAKSTAGFPDLLLANPERGRLVAIDCKTEVGRVTPAQQAWLDGLAACGVAAVVIRPSAWHAGRVEELLR